MAESLGMPEELKHLDFDPEPIPCNCHRHGADGCPGVASKRLLLHALHNCNLDQPGVVGGDVVQLMCEPCAHESVRLASALIDQWKYRLVSHQPLQCFTCQRSLERVDDIAKLVDLE